MATFKTELQDINLSVEVSYYISKKNLNEGLLNDMVLITRISFIGIDITEYLTDKRFDFHALENDILESIN